MRYTTCINVKITDNNTVPKTDNNINISNFKKAVKIGVSLISTIVLLIMIFLIERVNLLMSNKGN